jgi:hypothetical protein
MRRIGLISLGKKDPNGPSATSQFDYFQVSDLSQGTW